jgi:hypothetical protein
MERDMKQQKLIHYVKPHPPRIRKLHNEEVPRPRPLLQPNLAVFGMGLKNVTPTYYHPETLQSSFKSNQQRFLELPRGILYILMEHMTIGDIRNMCQSIPGMQEKCIQEFEFANMETTASLDFYYIISDNENGDHFDQGDPVQLSVYIRWASPDELIAKLEALNEFSGRFDSQGDGGWHFVQELWDGHMSLNEFLNSINNMTLDELRYGEMRWQFNKVGDLDDLVPGYEDFDRDQAYEEHGGDWHEQFVPENAFDELDSYVGHVTWNVSHEDADLESELETIMDVNYQRNRNVQQELREIIAKQGVNLPQETVNLILQFAGIITPENEIQRGQGRRQRLFF